MAGLHALVEDLVIANRILAHEGVVDGFGHVKPSPPGATRSIFHVAVA